jgi:glycosyltransferase involved in cell wall biosynthesis
LPLTVGYVGRFEAIKGVHDLARAWAALPKDAPLRLEFRGPVRTDAEERAIREARAIIGVDERVNFAAAVPAEQIPLIMAGYDLLCCPAVCLEGGPTVAIEAHAVGTPVIGTRIGGLAELVTDGVNGRLVTPGDWQALSAVMRDVAADPAATIDAWRTALPVARTMDDIAADYERMYEAAHA